jgi:maltose alpha-D-glucosyltransferase / alpha-amylase
MNALSKPLKSAYEPHGGFTKNPKPHTTVIDKGPYGYQHINAAIQRRDPESMLNWTERIIRMRKEVPEIGWGDFTVLSVRDRAVLALRYDWRNNSVLFLHNLHDQPREILLDPGVRGAHGKLLVIFLLRITVELTTPANTVLCWKAMVTDGYRVGGLDYLLRRTDIDQSDTDAD